MVMMVWAVPIPYQYALIVEWFNKPMVRARRRFNSC